MSAWTGGLANREYRRGQPGERVVDLEAVAGYVQAYLADCKRFRLVPSEDTCVVVVFGPKAIVREVYRAVTAGAR